MYKIVMNYPNPSTEAFISTYLKPCEFKYLSEEPVEKIYKKNIDMNYFIEYFANIAEEDKIILVGAEPLKHLFGASGVSKLSGTYQNLSSKLGNFKIGLLIDPKVITIYPHKKEEVTQAILALRTEKKGEQAQKNYEVAADEKSALRLIKYCTNATMLSYDLETTSLYPHKGDIIGVCLATKPHEGFFIPWKYVKIYMKEFQEMISSAKEIWFHHLKFDYKWSVYNGVKFPYPERLGDTMILSYLENENQPHGLKDLAISHTDLGNYDAELTLAKKAYCKKHKIKLNSFSYDLLPADVLGLYACKDADATMQLAIRYKEIPYPADLYTNIINASITLAEVELNGAYIDKSVVDLLDETYSKELKKMGDFLVDFAFNISGGEIPEFNPNSFMQIGNIVYNYLDYTPTVFTDTGSPSTSQEVLEELNSERPSEFIEKLISYRKTKKFHSTYVNSIKENLDSDGCIRTNFNITGTTSGRLSSSGTINLQNIPSKDKSIKKLFIPRSKGWIYYQQDLKTAEVWVAAHTSGDTFLREAFLSGMDFHGYTAKTIFGLKCSPGEVKTLFPKERSIAKTIVFAIMYGASKFRIAKELGISPKQAQTYIDMFFDKASTLRTFLDDKQQEVAATGILKSPFGRFRRVPEVFSTNKNLAEHYVKSAINFLFQSVASDINLFGFSKGMQEVKELEEKSGEKLFIPTALVHDSIVGEIKETAKDLIFPIFKKHIQNIIPNSFMPIGIDIEYGESWGTVK